MSKYKVTAIVEMSVEIDADNPLMAREKATETNIDKWKFNWRKFEFTDTEKII